MNNKLRPYYLRKKCKNWLFYGVFYPDAVLLPCSRQNLQVLKPSFESIHAGGGASFLARRFEEDSFAAPYHFHPEYELTFIVKGSGKRYVGTHMNDYADGDLVLLGSNLPHCWKTTPAGTGEKSVSIVIQFQNDFLGVNFFEAPEASRIRHLLTNSNYGLHFTGSHVHTHEKMQSILYEADAFKKLLLLLDLLHELASAAKYVMLDKKNQHASLPLNEKERMHAAMAYIVDNFQGNISLKGVAATASMTPEAFCKYFKKLTRKTFIEVVNDYRIDFARGQLVNTDKAISQIGFDSGFNDISNFYRTFKEHTSLSPLGYRKQYISQVK